ncbi:hypothetical protein [Bacillus coahuilensis]|uniref:hypothetical protein n=1 Tax=Bacillus coahuilensis TaxID=408580 RepID=UPI000750192D|nr:hypothetical protein [Bacillus coahuilensis]
MLVEINLLPQKEKKRQIPMLIAIILLILSFIVSAGMFILTQSINGVIEDQEIILQDSIEFRIALEAQLNSYNSSNSTVQLEEAVQWAENYPLETVPVLKSLIGLLPERGFFEEFGYEEDGTITLKVRFDTTRDAAYYLTNIKGDLWYKEAELLTLEVDEEVVTETVDQSALEENEILPRYVAEYTITVDKLLVKQEIEALEEEEE